MVHSKGGPRRTCAGTAAPQAWLPCRHPWGWSCSGLTLTDQNPHFCSLFQSQEEVPGTPSLPILPQGLRDTGPPYLISDPLSLSLLGSTLLPQFPSCHRLMWNWHVLRHHVPLPPPHVLFLREGSFLGSDTARDSPGLLDLESLGGGPTGLGTTGHTGPTDLLIGSQPLSPSTGPLGRTEQ